MGLGTALGLVWTILTRALGGGGIADTADRIMDRLVALRDAKTEAEKAQIEREIVQLRAISDLQRPSSRRWWSPMMIGQYLIVIPYGLWWASIFVVSIVNDNFGTGYVIQDIPSHIFEQAQWLIPVIVAGTVLERRR